MDAAIAIVWGVFWVGWLVAAFGAKKPVARRRSRPAAVVIIVIGALVRLSGTYVPLIGTLVPMATATTNRTNRRSAEPRRPRGAARREALLEAVLKIVAEVGPDAVTHRRVAEVAGLPLASTTYWFDSKEQLLTAALELAAARDTARLLAYGAEMEHSDVDPLDAVVAAVGDCDDGSQPNRGSIISTFALLLEAARRPALQQIAQRWTEAYLLTLSRLLERAGSSHPRADAELLIGATDGLLLEQLASGRVENLNPRLRRLAAALVAS